MRALSRVSVLLVAPVLLTGALGSLAQAGGLAVFAPMAAKYTIGGFSYVPPNGDGWRQVTSSADTFRIVYAERLGDDSLNTRVDVVAEAFNIPDPTLVTDVVSLAQKSQAQQAAERGKSLIAFSRVAPVTEASGVYSYSFRTQIGDTELQEIFFVVLANDKSEYFVAKVTTKEAEYTQAPYFAPLKASLANLKHTHASAEPSTPAPDKDD